MFNRKKYFLILKQNSSWLVYLKTRRFLCYVHGKLCLNKTKIDDIKLGFYNLKTKWKFNNKFPKKSQWILFN